jgi:CheY-like chemotaxis protein
MSSRSRSPTRDRHRRGHAPLHLRHVHAARPLRSNGPTGPRSGPVAREGLDRAPWWIARGGQRGPGKGAGSRRACRDRAPSAERPLGDGATGAGASTHRRVFADDNAISPSSFALLLRRMGHDVVEAHDGAEALQAARSVQPRSRSRHRPTEDERLRSRAALARGSETAHRPRRCDRMGQDGTESSRRTRASTSISSSGRILPDRDDLRRARLSALSSHPVARSAPCG